MLDYRGGGDKDSGTRSSLLWECERIIRAVKPKYLLMENVKNLIGEKHKHNFIKWLKVLESMGYKNWWKVLNAKDYGVPQNRERVFVVSILDGTEYLFPNPIKLEKRLKDILEPVVDEKYYLSNKLIEGFMRRIDRQDSGFAREINIRDKDNIASALTARMAKCGVTDNYIQEPVVCASRGRNPDNPSDRTTGSPTEQRIEINTTGCSNTLTSVQKDNYVVEPSVKQVGNIMETDSFGGNPQCGRVYSDDGISPTLNTMQGGQREPKILDDTYANRAVREYNEFSPTIRAEREGLKVAEGVSVNVNSRKAEFNGFKPISPALRATDYKCPHTYSNGYRIRKLTPLECWRLMGVKDEQFDKLHGISNSQLYKLAGNSIVVDVLMGIFKNLLVSDEGTKGQLTLL